jgi:hypothetical protein
MGVEFLKKVKKTIVKHIDVGRVKLATPDLLTRHPKQQPRTVVATVAKGSKLDKGDQLRAELSNGKLNLCRGNSILGPFDNPPADILAKIGETGGAALAKVKQIHALSGKVEVELC